MSNPPANNEAEMSVLGAVFMDNDALDTIAEIIKADDLYRESHRKIYRAMWELRDKNEPVDLMAMTTTLHRSKQLEECGGAAYLAELIDYVPTSTNVAYYARIVAEEATRRRLLMGVTESAKMIHEGKKADEVVTYIETAITAVSSCNQSAEPVEVRQTLRETLKALEVRTESKGEIQGIPYGIPELDTATNGMQRGDLIIVAGRPSMGKSAFAANVIESVCTRGMSALLFSLEMTRQQCMERMIASHGIISYTQLRSGNMEDSSWTKLTNAMGRLHQWQWSIDDTAGISFSSVRAKTKKLKRRGLDFLVVDYLQLMDIPDRDNRSRGLGDVTRGLKRIAKELDIPVMLLSQLSRKVEERSDKRPVMSDLRESGEIEQDADVILFPYRPAVYCGKCRDRDDSGDHSTREHQAKAEIIIEKQRNGERNVSIPVVWIGDNQKFTWG